MRHGRQGGLAHQKTSHVLSRAAGVSTLWCTGLYESRVSFQLAPRDAPARIVVFVLSPTSSRAVGSAAYQLRQRAGLHSSPDREGVGDVRKRTRATSGESTYVHRKRP